MARPSKAVKGIVGERIAARAKKLKIKHAALARMLDVPRSTVSGWVNSTHEPNLESLRGLAGALECSMAYLIGEASS